jgi:hypothetical protein
MVPVVPYAVLIATLVASHQCTSRSGMWLGICPPPKPPDIAIVEPAIEGTMLESFDQGFELRQYCNEDDCVLYRVYRRYVPRPIPHSNIETQIIGEEPFIPRGFKLDFCTLQGIKPC